MDAWMVTDRQKLCRETLYVAELKREWGRGFFGVLTSAPLSSHLIVGSAFR